MHLEGFTGLLPLFPLPDVVLFPGGLMPLHIFEPRYRAMVSDVLAGDPYVGMAVPVRGDLAGLPEILPVVGLGRMLRHEPLADGRSNILLQGLVRARVDEELGGRAYRLARVTLLPGDAPPAHLAVELHETLMSVLTECVQRAGGPALNVLKELRRNGVDLRQLTDMLCNMLPLELADRTHLLMETDALRRGQFLVERLRKSHADQFDIFRAATAARRRRPLESSN